MLKVSSKKNLLVRFTLTLGTQIITKSKKKLPKRYLKALKHFLSKTCLK